MKPQLKPRKGWKFRVIVATADGNLEYDDVNSERCVPEMAARLIVKLQEREEYKKMLEHSGVSKK